MVPNLVRRQRNQIFITFPENAGVSSYQVRGHQTLNGAFGASGFVGGSGTDLMFTLLKGQHFLSPSLMRRNFRASEVTRDPTRAIFDLDDYSAPSNNIPLDEDILFLRVAEYHQALGGYLPEGPIKIIPTPETLFSPKPMLTLSGLAPGVSGVVGGQPPAGAMHIQIPMFADTITISNRDTANDLLIACGRGTPLMEITDGTSPSFHVGSCSEFFLCGDQGAAAVAFSLTVSMVNQL